MMSRDLMRGCARRRALAGVAALLAALTGCGGGGGDDPAAATDPTVTAAAANPMPGTPGTVVLTVSGSHLDAGIGVAAPGCTSVTRSSSAPYASSASVAYYLCPTTVAAPGTLAFTVTRSRDAAALASTSHTIGATPTLAAVVAGTARYGQDLVVTATGTDVNQGLALTTVGCADPAMRLSVTPPYLSNTTTAHYRCRVAALDLNQVTVALESDPTTDIANVLYTVPQPEVTLRIRRDTVDLGEIVITLAPLETPLTVDNFLTYVNSGFYDGTVFHRVVVTPNPFVIQGGGFLPIATGLETPKTPRAPIPLEVNRGLSNVRWSVAMARTAAANSATSQFFVNLADNLFLDPRPASPGVPAVVGYAVFGAVTAGTAVVSAIAASPCQAIVGFSECVPNPNVVITSAVQTR